MSETAAAPVAAPTAAPESTPATPAEGQQPPAERPAAAPKQKAPQFRKFKTDDGEEVALSDDDIKREYQKWRGADKKFREAAEARKSVEQFMKALQEDPESVLNDPRLPLNRKKLAEKWLVQQLESELNPPDPRDAKLTEAERRLKEYEEREAKAKAEAEEGEKAKVREQRKAALSDTLAKAMQATHLAAHPESAAAVLREMATYMRAARERDAEVTPEELVQHIHNQRFHQLYTLAHQFEGDELIEFLGEEIVGRIRKADLARLRAQRDKGQTHRTEGQPREQRTGRFAPRMDPITAKRHAAKIMGD